MSYAGRERLSVPSERVCIDLVGPFPRAKGGLEYLLTYIDVATRRQEAIPLRKVTSTVVIIQLKDIFAPNVFPTTLITDNRSQFYSTQFESFLKDHGIEYVTTYVEKKGSWWPWTYTLSGLHPMPHLGFPHS